MLILPWQGDKVFQNHSLTKQNKDILKCTVYVCLKLKWGKVWGFIKPSNTIGKTENPLHI